MNPDITLITQFLSINKNSKIYCISKNVTEYIEKNVKKREFNLIKIQDEQFFSKEIENYVSYSHVSNISELYLKIGYWGNILNCIAGFLIKQSYFNSKLDRKNNWINYFEQEINETKMKKEDLFIIRCLSQTNSSLISIVCNVQNDRVYVLKKFIDSDESQKLFEREKNIYLNISHLFLPKFFCSLELNEKEKFLIIEYLPGKTLNKIDKSKLNEEDIIRITFELMITIKYLHNLYYVYRDLKPNNIIIDENNNAFLIDFDRMINLDDCEEEENIIFTTDFQSIYHDHELDKGCTPSFNSDIYSLNKILLEYFSIELDYSDISDDDDDFDDLKLSKLIDIFYFDFFLVKKRSTTLYNDIVFLYLICYFWKFPDCLRIGMIYFKGAYIYRNQDLEADCFIIGQEESAEEFIPYLYRDIHFIKPNIDIFIQFLTYLALHHHDPTAQYKLGCVYFDGKYVKQDINMAIFYYSLAAHQNQVDSLIQLGLIYKNGDLIPPNINKAIYFFELGARQNDKISQYHLGTIYLEDKSMYNINKAIHYFTLSAEQNLTIAQVILGIIYMDEENIKSDINKSIYYLSLAADLNDINALNILGLIYTQEKYFQINTDNAIHYLLLGAQKNIKSSLCCLGELYYNGKYVKQDINKAIYYLKQAADQNYDLAQYNLGFIYEKMQEIKKSIFYYSLAANQGDENALINLGTIYYYGTKCKRDISKAIHYFTLAANKNNPLAQTYLGIIYSNYDNNKSLNYFLLAANQNEENAQYFLGLSYYKGEKVKRDYSKAIHYLTLASQKNEFRSNLLLGIIYLEKNIPRNVDKAMYYFNLAVKSKNPQVLGYVADIYLHNPYIPHDFKKALHYYELAAEQNENESQYSLGEIYENGEYVHRDIKKALYYYTLSAKQNNSKALYKLGIFYLEGKYYPLDINKALYYLTESAIYKNSNAQEELAHLYLEGKYVPFDLNKSIKYYTMAAYNNNEKACIYLCYIFLNVFDTKTSKDIKKAINYLELAIKNGSFVASFILGFIYHEGKEVEFDIEKAIYYYKNSSSFNFKFAKNNLGIIYKNGIHEKVEKNSSYAIEYFTDVIKKDNDMVSMYNLAHLYLYEEQITNKIDYAIELLIKSSIMGFYHSNKILCLALFKKVGSDLTNAEKEIKKYIKNSNDLFLIIQQITNDYQLLNEESFDNMYESYRNADFLYDYFMTFVPSIQFENARLLSQKLKENPELIKISKDFYEGFGI